MSDDKDKIQQYLKPSSEILGSTGATAIGLVLGGTGGALVGAAMGPVVVQIIRRTCSEIADRVLGHRQTARSGAAAVWAMWVIEGELNQGRTVRNDGFFDVNVDRSDADEILDGVMIKSGNDHEERKAKHYGNMFATAAFDGRFSVESLNHAMSIAQRLTFRQLSLLQVFSDNTGVELNDQYYRDRRYGEIPWETHAVLSETFDLYQLGLVRCKTVKGDSNEVLLGFGDICPKRMRHTELGARLHFLMKLSDLPREDLESVALHIRG